MQSQKVTITFMTPKRDIDLSLVIMKFLARLVTPRYLEIEKVEYHD